jgi:two-component system OmpR family response regulator
MIEFRPESEKTMSLPLARGSLPSEAHLLLVEDDGETRHLVARLLRENGFRVTAARDGREMWETIQNAKTDLVLLDVMLPGTSGLDLCRELRLRGSIPIIMLTARGSETDRVVGLELGADDYIAKPFSRPELLARIRAVLRRALAAPDPERATGGRVIGFGGWILDTSRRELTAPSGSGTDLSTAEYDLLLAFLEHPQRVLTRDQILELSRHRVGDVFDRSVDVLVSRLRRKLEPHEESPSLIKTVRGAGYMFCVTPRRL